MSLRTNKLLLTGSNLLALPAILLAQNWRDALLLCAAMTASFVHHGMERRYYGPVLWQTSVRTQWWWLQADRFFALVAIMGVGRVALLVEQWPWLLVGVSFMMASEAVMFPRCPLPRGAQRKDLRCWLHVAWHTLSLGFAALLAVTVYSDSPTLWAWLSQ